MTALGTPKSSTFDDGYASWLPRDIPYSAAFEDSLSALVLNTSWPSNAPSGIRVLDPNSNEQPIADRAIQASSVSSATLPDIPFTSLPLDLSDSRRIYASALPGVLLTHPTGYLEGGPSISPSEDEFARHFISDHRIRTPAELSLILEAEIKSNIELIKERSRAREEAKEKNAAVERELRTLEDQMEMEMKVLVKAREKAKEKRERKERKAKERGQG